jgi:hypothetical protein
MRRIGSALKAELARYEGASEPLGGAAPEGRET